MDIKDPRLKNYIIKCSDWEKNIIAVDASIAASTALSIAIAEKGQNLNLSYAIEVYEASRPDESRDIFYTPEILADIGMHELSKKLDAIFKSWLSEK